MGPDAGGRVRAIRLRALTDAPDAFRVAFAEDEARPLVEWRTRLESPDNATFIASERNQDVGLAVGSRHQGQDGAAGIFAMWVAPEARDRGIGGALVDAVVAWARAGGYRRVLLDVADRNVQATRLFAKKGFAPTGATGSLPAPREHILEHQ
ncbi:MAG TPA: GNAT family N-acetyltransferase, partial [Candidatus Limnocylindrales bacterium]|nr:GNAT family N-acetyltransferase [Candidatus Limnocylindrales bacterium]